jgi:transposase InsO family protein
MPFKETDRVEQREALVEAWKSGTYRVADLARQFGVSRPTVYLWIDRQNTNESLSDRSRAPHQIPHRTDPQLIAEILGLRKQHPKWGPKKLLAILREREPDGAWPAASTVGDLLKSQGLVSPRRRRNREVLERERLIEPAYAGQVMTADFKGQFRLGNGRYCYPLTIADPHSRFIYAIQALESTSTAGARPIFERVFREHGLPEMIVTDNGEPFCAPQGFARLSRLSVTWLRLGIEVRQTRPGQPQDNGRHERMHKTLKAETTRPPERTMLGQQRRFNAFRFTFNHHRPHESLGQRAPASMHFDPLRKCPRRVAEPSYPGHFEVRRVRHGGEIRWKGDRFFLSQCLAGELVGLEEIDDGIWSLHFAGKLLGRFHENERVLR